MKNIQSPLFLRKSKFILILILMIFFLKGVLLSSSFPIFGGQDESRHYNTIQFLNEPSEKNWAMEKQDEKQDKDNIDTTQLIYPKTLLRSFIRNINPHPFA